MSLDFLITNNPATFKDYTGIKIKYENEWTINDHITIGNCGLLFENDIREQDTTCFKINNYNAFFKTENADLSFDIFAASFYLVSRYEEYLPHKKDMFGRYAHENSLAFRERFLHLPIINTWVGHLIEIIQRKFPGSKIQRPPFAFIPTYDIDMAFSYKHKGWKRNAGGFLKSPSLKRILVLLGVDIDPFDTFDELDKINSRYKLLPIYFFLLAEKNGRYDKNILPGNDTMQALILQHAKKYSVGIHPSWQSGDRPILLRKEKEQLEAVIKMPVKKSRQHYIRLDLPNGYRQLQENGISDDYSMGYGSINGFRASVASSFYWYDLQKNEATSLRIHPFCFMDANSMYEQKYTPAEAFEELRGYYTICKEVDGQLITIWHNNFLGTDPQFAGWLSVYQRFISMLQP